MKVIEMNGKGSRDVHLSYMIQWEVEEEKRPVGVVVMREGRWDLSRRKIQTDVFPL